MKCQASVSPHEILKGKVNQSTLGDCSVEFTLMFRWSLYKLRRQSPVFTGADQHLIVNSDFSTPATHSDTDVQYCSLCMTHGEVDRARLN